MNNFFINIINISRILKIFIFIINLIIVNKNLFSFEPSWKVVDSMPNMSLFYMGIECYDSLNCISIANRKAIETWSRITNDGGKTWKTTLQDTSKLILNDSGQVIGIYNPPKAKCITYPDSNLCIVGCDSGYIWRSIDYCQTWYKEKLDTVSIESISMLNNQYGSLISSFNLYLTSNGGLNWVKQNIIIPDSLKPAVFSQVIMPEENVIICLVYRKEFKDYLLITYNNGKDWEVIHNFKNRIWKIHFFNKNEGIASGGDQIAPYSQKETSVILYTEDGGETWLTKLDSLFFRSTALLDIAFCDRSNGIIRGSNWIFWKTTDGGKSWVVDSSNLYPTVNGSFADLEIIKPNTYIGCTWITGCIYKYSDEITNIEDYNFIYEFQIFPNPASDRCYIKLKTNYFFNNPDIKIYNELGVYLPIEAIIKSDNGNELIYEINTSNLSSGFYYIIINNGNEVKSVPFIVYR